MNVQYILARIGWLVVRPKSVKSVHIEYLPWQIGRRWSGVSGEMNKSFFSGDSH